MKPCTRKANLFPTLLTISLCILSTVPDQAVSAGIINGGFETGTLEGWTLSLPGEVWVDRFHDDVYERHVLYPYENSNIPWLTDYASVTRDGFEGALRLHQRGIYFAPSVHAWTMDDGWTYRVESPYQVLRIEQTIHLSSGMLTISGWANYGTWCPSTNFLENPALISVNGATIWSHDTTTVAPAASSGQLRTTGWEDWTFTAPTEGDYTLTLDIGPICQYFGYAELDGVQVIPEPAVVALGILGAAIFHLRRQRK